MSHFSLHVFGSSQSTAIICVPLGCVLRLFCIIVVNNILGVLSKHKSNMSVTREGETCIDNIAAHPGNILGIHIVQ